MTTVSIDEERLNGLIGQLLGDYGAAISSALVLLGDRLGLYAQLAKGPQTPSQLAAAAGTSERFAADWLLNQAASGYVTRDEDHDSYYMTPEQALLFSDPNAPVSAPGGFQVLTAAVRSVDRIEAAVRTGEGVPWSAHHQDLFEGTRRFFEPGYVASLIHEWLPALDGVTAKLEAGASVADVGCGYGASTILMANAFPASRFVGYDNHAPSIEEARAAAAVRAQHRNVTFEVADARNYPGSFDLIAFFDCFHDMGRLDQVARHAAAALKPDGSVMLVEPMAGRSAAENLNPVGRIFSAASVLICSPNATADGGPPLGTVATDEEIGRILLDNGFRSFRRATETPFNRIFEVRR